MNIILFEKVQDFKQIVSDSLEEMRPYFQKVNYEACEYNFITLYMWQTVYDFHYITKENYMVVFGRSDEGLFAIQPICENKYMHEALEYIKSIFEIYDSKMVIKAVTEPVREYLQGNYPEKFEYETNRDDYDYIYEAESLRTLGGRKMHSKKNHFNGFLKEYGDRYVYKAIDKSEFDECLRLADKWAFSREKDKNLIGENLAIKKVLKNSAKFKCLKIGGIYIDNELEAFTFGDHINEELAVIHIEKANPDLRGVYSAINKLFLQNEFPDVKYVNREDDLGIEGLRQAKLSYKPFKLVEKYTVDER
ncbi:MAG: phosphatidylglycerol lysyltransferase domain-containing protein [Proteocatella sp.]